MDILKVKEVCKIGQGHECCRYIGMGGSGFCCMKLISSAKEQLDHRVKLETIIARGDNCEGEKSE